MKPTVQFRDLGLIEYKEAWDFQENLFSQNIIGKQQQRNGDPATVSLINHLLFCQHPHVYTIGKSGKAQNLLVNPDFLKSIGATVVQTNRGGDITYHGPGQLVGYPIFDLEQFGLSVKEYVDRIEESVIRLLNLYGLEGQRSSGATGVWLGVGTPRERKICAIGVRASRYITMHGFALNINTDLKYFTYINPCGFTDKGVTSLAKELKGPVAFQQTSEQLKGIMCEVFGFSFSRTP